MTAAPALELLTAGAAALATAGMRWARAALAHARTRRDTAPTPTRREVAP